MPEGKPTGWRAIEWTTAGGWVRSGMAAGWVKDVRGTLLELGVPEEDLATLTVIEPSIPLRPWPERPVEAAAMPEPPVPEPTAAPDAAEPTLQVQSDDMRTMLAEAFPGAAILAVRALVDPGYTPMPDDDPPPDNEDEDDDGDAWTPPDRDWQVSPGGGPLGTC